MARERAFDEDQVLQAAADVFAVHGYGNTSLAMLLDATGVGKQSLYNSFGDKRSLYLKAVACSAERWHGVQQAMLAAATGRAAVSLFFERLLSQCSSDDPAERSCVVSAGLLEGIDDALVQSELRAKWAASREMLREALERGQRDGSIASREPSALLADLAMNLMSGLRVAARAGTDAARLAHTARLGLSVLDTG